MTNVGFDAVVSEGAVDRLSNFVSNAPHLRDRGFVPVADSDVDAGRPEGVNEGLGGIAGQHSLGR
ncbi:MAG: hypothetical protein ACI91O_001248 [Candidatus Poriferisodalaceae bacterium]|jgi:hypothetical protein